MKRSLVGMAAASAVVVSSLLATAPAAHAIADGTIVVNIVDQYGRPTAGVVVAMDSTGTQYYDGPGGSGTYVFGSSHTLTVPPEGYAFESITPWSGIDCAGLASCSVAGAPTITPVVTVTSGSASTYTMHVTVPSITGGSAVGSPVTVQIPPGLTTLQSFFAALPGATGPMAQQWLRGGVDIPGATSPSYTTTPLDGLQSVSARLAPSGIQSYIAAIGGGGAVQPFTTNAITMAKFVPLKTKTKVKVPRSIGAGDRVSMKVKVKGKGSKAAPTGLVTVTIGQFKVKKKLKGGSVFINLPNLKVGTYKITASYGGSIYFAKSKDKNVPLIVHK